MTEANYRRSFCALLLAFALTSGCAVLTRSQVGQVKQFAAAAKTYDSIPADVLIARRDIGVTDAALTTSTLTDPNSAWQKAETAASSYSFLSAQSQRLSQALKILDVYSDLLTTLSSNTFNDSLNKSATALGNNLDKLVRDYNTSFKGNLPAVGAVAGAAVRGLGGIFIRYKQAQLLKAYVDQADPMIAQLTLDIEALLNDFIQGRFFEKQADDIQTNFQGEMHLTPDKITLATAQSVIEALIKIQAARELVQRSLTATGQFRLAHEKLKDALNEPVKLSIAAEEIQTLAVEIKAADQVRKSIK